MRCGGFSCITVLARRCCNGSRLGLRLGREARSPSAINPSNKRLNPERGEVALREPD
jgi:hypothetical protein